MVYDIERLNNPNKVVGIKQTKTAIKSGTATVVYVASDADFCAVEEVLSLCKNNGIELVCDYSRKEIARACKVDVPSAAAAILK